MKARIKTDFEKISLLERSEIMRINKIWMMALHNRLRYTQNGICGVYGEVCEIAGKLYEDPEYWGQIDELLCDKFELGDIVPMEDVDEREKLSAEIHKRYGKKWRRY